MHCGEIQPDGDEILYVISGRLRVVGDPEKTQLLHITPGPNGDHGPQ